MANYAIYKFELNPFSYIAEGNLPFTEIHADSSNKTSDVNMLLNQYLGELTRQNEVEKFSLTMLAQQDRVTLLRMEKPETLEQYAKMPQTGEINKVFLPSYPYTYVVVDCREGKNMIAINTDNDAWRNTDTAAKLLMKSLNELMKSKEVAYNINIKPEGLPRDFWAYNAYLVKVQHKKPKKLSIYLTNGLADPRIEAMFKRKRYISLLLKETFGSKRSKHDYYDPEGSQIISRHGKTTLEQLAVLITSEIVRDSFGLSMSYEGGIVVTCGKDVRAEFEMEYDTFLSMTQCNLFGQSNIEYWLDGVVDKINKLRDGASVEQKAIRKRKRRVQDTSAALNLF